MATATTERIYKLTVDASAAVAKLDQIAASTGSMEQKMTKAGSAMDMAFKGLAAGGAIVGALMSLEKFLNYADKLADTADAFGTSATAISAWSGAIQQAGGDAEKTDKLFQKTADLIQNIVDDKAPDSIKRLGISFNDIKGLNVEQSFDLIVQRLAAIKDDATRTATAMDIFGKSAIGVDFKKLAEDAKLLDKNIGDFEVNIRAAADAADYLASIFKKLMGLGASMFGSFANDMARFKASIDGGKWIPLEEWNKKIADGIKEGAEKSKAALEKLRTEQNNAAKAQNGAKEHAAEMDKLNKATEQQVISQLKWEQSLKDSLSPMNEVDRNLAKLETAMTAGRLTQDQYAEGFFKIMEQGDKLKTIKEPLDEIGVAIGNTLSDGVGQLVDQFANANKSWGQFATDFLKSIASMITKLLLLKAIEASLKGTSAGNFLGIGVGKSMMPGETPTLRTMGTNSFSSDYTVPTIGALQSSGINMQQSSNPVNVVINNNAPVEVSQTATQGADGATQLTIMIEKKVKDLIGSGGLDKTMRGAYGLTRQPA